MSRLYNNQQQKKRIWKIVDFAFPADHRKKIKESEKNDKYHDLAWELKKQRNMKVTVILIVIGALNRVILGLINIILGLIKGLENLDITVRVETIQTATFLRFARILRRVLDT